MSATHSAIAGSVLRQWSSLPGLQLVQIPANVDVRQAQARYLQTGNVVYAEPNYVVHMLATPDDPFFPQLWNLQNTGQLGGVSGADIHAAQAWNLTTGSASAVVVTIDTGFDYNHPDLAPNIWSNPSSFSLIVNNTSINCAAGTHGYNAITGACDPMDDNAHGTHVSGIIGAAGNNAVGVVGVNWNVQMLACKFLDKFGQGAISDAITCLDFVKALKDNGVNIIATNNSWGGSPFSQALSDAVALQQQDGILFIAAAGNDFSDNDMTPVYPASLDLPNVISVSATTRFDVLADFSNVGQHSVHVSAPGQEILSTPPNGTYSIFSGTSMSAPEVTGVAALLWAQNSTRDWRTIKNLILSGGDVLPAVTQTIAGRRLNAYGSMTCSNTQLQSRLQPRQSVVAGAVGTPLRLEELSIQCAQPTSAVQVTVSPGGQVINLVDNGSNGDLASGDGVFSGLWTPTATGSYTLTFPGGDVVDVEVLTNYSATMVSANYISFSGTSLNLDDDSVATISLPFPVLFGGGSFNKIYVSSNGTASFTDAFDWYNNSLIPQHLGPGRLGPEFFSIVAPFWQDLFPVPNTQQNVFWAVVGAAPSRQVILEWRNVPSFACRNARTANITFQAIFNESSSDVQFNYANAAFGGTCSFEDYGATATVGIQVAPNNGTQWSINAQDIPSNSSILWQLGTGSTTPHPVPTLSVVSPNSAPQNNAPLTITVIGSNFVLGSRVRWNGADRATTFVSSTQLTAVLSAQDMSRYVGTAYVDVFTPGPGGGTSNFLPFMLTASAPVITSLSPQSVAAGSFSFVLTVNGSGFSNGAGVYWNGQPLQFSFYQGPNQIVTSVFANQIANPGTAQITVHNPGGPVSNALTFNITQSPGGMFLTSPFMGPSTPNSGAPANPKPPFQFLGWKYATQRGGDYLNHFLRARAHTLGAATKPQQPTPFVVAPLSAHANFHEYSSTRRLSVT